jgi:hypothetical protein
MAYEDEVLGLREQQKTAQKIRENAQMPTGQMAGGWYVPPSNMQYLAEALKQFGGAYSEGKARREEKALTAARDAEIESALGGMDESGKIPKESLVKLLRADPTTAKALMTAQKSSGNLGYNFGYNNEGKLVRMSKATGQVGIAPNEDENGNPISSALYDPEAIAARQRAKESATGHIMEGPTGQKGLYTGRQANPQEYGGGFVGQSAPQMPQAQQQGGVEISANASPEDRAMLEGIARQQNLPISRGSIGEQILGPSPAQQAESLLSVEQKKQQIKTEEDLRAQKQTAVKNATESLPLLLDAQKLLPSSTGSLPGSIYDKVVGKGLGYATEGAKAASRLKIIGSQLTGKVPRAPGAQSEAELKLYKEQSGNLGDDTLSVGERQDALNWLIKYNSDIAKYGQYTGNTEEDASVLPSKGIETKTIKGVTYQKINGEWHTQ